MKKYMKKFLSIFILGVLTFSLIACGEKKDNTKSTNGSKQVTKEATSKNKYANKFSVEYLDNNVKLVTDGADRKVLLVPKEGKKPEGYDNIPVIRTPIDNVLLCSTMQTSLIRPLDVYDSIKCVTKYNVNEGHIDEINKRMQKGDITYVGKIKALDYELIKSKKPEVAFIISVDVPKLAPKFDELGIPYIVESSSLENHPLGRMEWIKFMSLFYNKEDIADKHLKMAEETITNVNNKLKGKDKTLVTAGVAYKGKFSVRRGGSYQGNMYPLAGGEYVFKDLDSKKGGAASISFEDFYAKSVNADIYVYEAMTSSRPKTINDVVAEAPITEKMKAIKSGQVWITQPWWSQSVDKLHEIIEDLAAICHPEEFKDHKIQHYHKLEK